MADFRQKRNEGHYFIDGKKLPSVTTILGICTPPALISWFKKTDFAKQEKVSQDAKDWGTLIHDVLEMLLRARVAGTEERYRNTVMFTQPKLVKDAIDAFDEFEREVGKINPLAIEETLHTDIYAGTCDLIGECETQGLILLDFKTSKRIYETYSLQLHAYAHAYNVMTGKLPKVLYCVRIDKETGKLERKKYEFEDKVLNVFLHILSVYEYFYPKTPLMQPQELNTPAKLMHVDGMLVQIKD